MTDFKRLLEDLSAQRVEFILVGGLAAIAHGAARMTQDIDVLYSRAPENLSRIVLALAEHHPYLRGAPPGLPFDFSVETIERGLNFTLQTDVGDIDLWGEILGGGGYQDLLDHTISIEVFGHSVRVLGLEKLIEVKKAAGRPKDLEAIAELETVLEELE